MRKKLIVYIKEKDIKENKRYSLLLEDFEARMLEFFNEEEKNGNLTYMEGGLYLFDVECIYINKAHITANRIRYEYTFKYKDKYILLESADYSKGWWIREIL